MKLSIIEAIALGAFIILCALAVVWSGIDQLGVPPP